MEAINIADIRDTSTGKTIREENSLLTHNIPLGTLVEVDFDDSHLETKRKGLRLWVVSHDRDFDGTPIYGLSFDKDWKPDMFGSNYKSYALAMVDKGYSEGSLKIVK